MMAVTAPGQGTATTPRPALLCHSRSRQCCLEPEPQRGRGTWGQREDPSSTRCSCTPLRSELHPCPSGLQQPQQQCCVGICQPMHLPTNAFASHGDVRADLQSSFSTQPPSQPGGIKPPWSLLPWDVTEGNAELHLGQRTNAAAHHLSSWSTEIIHRVLGGRREESPGTQLPLPHSAPLELTSHHPS